MWEQPSKISEQFCHPLPNELDHCALQHLFANISKAVYKCQTYFPLFRRAARGRLSRQLCVIILYDFYRYPIDKFCYEANINQ